MLAAHSTVFPHGGPDGRRRSPACPPHL